VKLTTCFTSNFVPFEEPCPLPAKEKVFVFDTVTEEFGTSNTIDGDGDVDVDVDGNVDVNFKESELIVTVAGAFATGRVGAVNLTKLPSCGTSIDIYFSQLLQKQKLYCSSRFPIENEAQVN
jgi:hypothetical protein